MMEVSLSASRRGAPYAVNGFDAVRVETFHATSELQFERVIGAASRIE
jgi:hypothetical protein